MQHATNNMTFLHACKAYCIAAGAVGGIMTAHHSMQRRSTTAMPNRVTLAVRDGVIGAILFPVLLPYMAASGTSPSMCAHTWAKNRNGRGETPPMFE